MYKRWRVYSTFLTGILIGLFYAVLVGGRLFTDLETSELSVEGQVLILSFSGILGGVVYTIMLDGHVEMPRFIGGRGNQFKAGLFGDILLGIAGAFILEALLPSELLTSPVGSGEPELRNTAIAATGIIGGYGGRAILQFALNRFFNQSGALSVSQSPTIPSVDEEVEELQSGAVDQALGLTDQIDAYIRDGASGNELARLQSLLSDTDAKVQQQVFEDLIELRSPEMGLQLTSEQLQRMIPLFEVLIDGAPKNHRCAGELALIYRDLEQPDYSKALRYLDQAITLRGPLTMGQPWEYELNRAATKIQQINSTNEGFKFASHLQDTIIADLLTIARVYNLNSILKVFKQQQVPTPVLDWINHNHGLLETRPDTRELFVDLRKSLAAEPQEAVNVPSPQAPDQTSPQVEEPEVQNSHSGSILTPIEPASHIPANPEGLKLPEIYQALGKCYDILSLDPFDISGTAKKHRVFNFYDGEAEAVQDEVSKLKPSAPSRLKIRVIESVAVSSMQRTGILCRKSILSV
ncbi:MAG: hypothetical protein AAGE59_34230 [Cyanobacteria bacterium P01_F01_bin.86]